MSARNAQLEIENESLKNELQNSRADYAALQVDMNDIRDYYHQIDIAASKMGHRCEVRSTQQSWWGLIVMIRLSPGALIYFGNFKVGYVLEDRGLGRTFKTAFH